MVSLIAFMSQNGDWVVDHLELRNRLNLNRSLGGGEKMAAFLAHPITATELRGDERKDRLGKYEIRREFEV